MGKVVVDARWEVEAAICVLAGHVVVVDRNTALEVSQSITQPNTMDFLYVDVARLLHSRCPYTFRIQ